mmetsp:Transcript_2903/g.10167  ORF Transcript_2903/g.10167 Transcript_2903/m.10167 type:complete len:217 (+) Transcript_2903:3682-4332(+)
MEYSIPFPIPHARHDRLTLSGFIVPVRDRRPFVLPGENQAGGASRPRAVHFVAPRAQLRGRSVRADHHSPKATQQTNGHVRLRVFVAAQRVRERQVPRLRQHDRGNREPASGDPARVGPVRRNRREVHSRQRYFGPHERRRPRQVFHLERVRRHDALPNHRGGRARDVHADHGQDARFIGKRKSGSEVMIKIIGGEVMSCLLNPCYSYLVTHTTSN